MRDDSALVCRAVINSDLTIFASPVIMGYTSALLKKAQDRLLPLLRPYLEVHQGEMHHRARYDRRPRLALLVEPEPDTDAEDIAIIIEGVYRRNAINLQSSLAFAKSTMEPVEAIANATGGA